MIISKPLFNGESNMKKIIATLLTAFLFLLPLSACKEGGTGTTVRLNEVTHSVFYAPLYLAIEQGYFEENGITVELTNGGGADKSMTAVLSGTADIGLMGPESAIYIKPSLGLLSYINN